MIREELKTKGCLFGHLSDIDSSLLDELRKLDVIKNPENFRRVTHSGSLIKGSNEATACNTYEEANQIKELHLKTNKGKGLWQTFFTWDSNTQNKEEYIPIMRNIFLEVFKYSYGEEYLDKIWEINGTNVNLTHFNKDCFIDAHADGGGKRMICNILVYLNDNWTEEDGGELVIEGGYTQKPIFGNFAVLDFMHINPKHSVIPIKTENFDRYTILTGILFEENFFNQIN